MYFIVVINRIISLLLTTTFLEAMAPTYDPSVASQVQNLIYDRSQDDSYSFKLSKAIERMLPLPQQRPLELRKGQSCIIDHKKSINFQAALAYVVGNQAPTPCHKCQSQSAVFVRCVAVRGEMKGSCSNCYYGGEGSGCTLRPRKFHPSISYFVFADSFNGELSGAPRGKGS